MKKVIIYGSGSTGRSVYASVKNTDEVIAFLDSDSSKWGSNVEGIAVVGDAKRASDYDYDVIFIASLTGKDLIHKALLEEGIPESKINVDFVQTKVEARINFLRDFAHIHGKKIGDYAVAEGGVFQGEFAKVINEVFPKSKIYLFDTFEGFDKRDTEVEHEHGYSIYSEGHLSDTSEDIVMSKLPHPENAVLRKGFFPETAKGLESEKFFFVNLDFDLYEPILEGLRFFYPRLSSNGVMLVHDYFNPGYLGVPKAIEDFEKEIGHELLKYPIGDHVSIAIMNIDSKS